MNENVLPSAGLFDINAVLQGRNYPEVEVDFYIDEASALTLSRIEKELNRLAILGRTEEHDALEPKGQELRKALASARYVYHLRGVPQKVRQDIYKKAYEKYPREQNFVGVEEENPERDQYYTSLLWQAMTVKIVAPNGAVQVNPSLETIQQFRDYAPLAALNAIDAGIQELSAGVKAGFEAAAQDTDFLSRP